MVTVTATDNAGEGALISPDDSASVFKSIGTFRQVFQSTRTAEGGDTIFRYSVSDGGPVRYSEVRTEISADGNSGRLKQITYLDSGNNKVFELSDLDFEYDRGSSINPEELNDRIYRGDTTIIGNKFGDFLAGVEGNDSIKGNAGPDFLAGGQGNDTLVGDQGNDSALGGVGDDQIWAGQNDTGADGFFGEEGNDTIGGGRGNDTLGGNEGNDQIFGGGGNDLLNGHEGADVVWAGAGYDFALGGTGTDTVGGGAGDDVIVGNEGHDVIYGATGRDVISGGTGRDTLFGGDEGDRLLGGMGNDQMFGGRGNDVFIFEDGHGSDSIGGFTSKGTNKIDLSELDLSGMDALSIRQSGSDTVIQTGQGTITLWDVNRSDIDASDFVF